MSLKSLFRFLYSLLYAAFATIFTYGEILKHFYLTSQSFGLLVAQIVK